MLRLGRVRFSVLASAPSKRSYAILLNKNAQLGSSATAASFHSLLADARLIGLRPSSRGMATAPNPPAGAAAGATATPDPTAASDSGGPSDGGSSQKRLDPDQEAWEAGEEPVYEEPL